MMRQNQRLRASAGGSVGVPRPAASPGCRHPGCRRPGRRAAPTAAAAQGSSSSSSSSSIRDFIANEAPLRSLVDGAFRERPLEPTLEAPYLIAGALPQQQQQQQQQQEQDGGTAAAAPLAFLPPVPGGVSLHALDPARLRAVVASGGRVVLLVVEEGRPECVAAPSSTSAAAAGGPRRGSKNSLRGSGGGSGGGGSYAVAGRVAGVLGGLARVVAEARVAVQAVEARSEGGGGDGGAAVPGTARAAELEDRWCYMCRRPAIEAALLVGAAARRRRGHEAAAPPQPPPPPLPREVALAVEQARDAAREVAAELRACRELAAAMAEQQEEQEEEGKGTSAAAADAEAELRALLEWCFAEGGGDGKGVDDEEDEDSLSWARLVRLSYAPFAASALASLVARVSPPLGGGGGNGEGALAAARLRAMATTDAGARLEDAAELASGARRRLAAVRALRN
jgi:hypothetical protein